MNLHQAVWLVTMTNLPRKPKLPEPFALISISFAALGLLSFAPMVLAAAGFGQDDGFLGAMARRVGTSWGVGALSGGFAFIAGVFGLAFHSERLARIGLLVGIALVILLVVAPIGFLAWEILECSHEQSPAPDHCHW